MADSRHSPILILWNAAVQMKLGVWILLVRWNAQIRPIAPCLCRGRVFAGGAQRADTNDHSEKNEQPHGLRSGLTFRISDLAPRTSALEPRRNRGVRCIRLVRRHGFRSERAAMPISTGNTMAAMSTFRIVVAPRRPMREPRYEEANPMQATTNTVPAMTK